MPIRIFNSKTHRFLEKYQKSLNSVENTFRCLLSTFSFFWKDICEWLKLTALPRVKKYNNLRWIAVKRTKRAWNTFETLTLNTRWIQSRHGNDKFLLTFGRWYFDVIAKLSLQINLPADSIKEVFEKLTLNSVNPVTTTMSLSLLLVIFFFNISL